MTAESDLAPVLHIERELRPVDDPPGRDRRGTRLFDGIDTRALAPADLKTVGDDGVIVQILSPRSSCHAE
jgi:hypothetical protein